MSWIREPVLSPDGQTMAMVSDGPNPSQSDVVLQLYDITTKKLTVPKLAETPPLGHQDPAWRPGRQVPAVRPERPRLAARRAADHRYDVGQEEGARR